MADLIDTLAAQTGINPETARKGFGALLTFMKSHLDSDVFGKVQSSLPGADGAVSAYDSARDSGQGQGQGPGLLGTVAGLAGKLLGGQGADAAKLLGMLSQVGISADQVQTFLPRAFELMRQHLPADVVEKIKALLPLPGQAAESP